MGVRERRLSGLLAVRSMLSAGTAPSAAAPCPRPRPPGALGRQLPCVSLSFPLRKLGSSAPTSLGFWGRCCPGKGRVSPGQAGTEPSQAATAAPREAFCPGQWSARCPRRPSAPAGPLPRRPSPYLLRDLVKVDELEIL